ncbi:MAG: Ig-like domain-containing protein [Bacteroidetes bacterium]|nr:Ig-like domain-containing protein [Bacteroidota bacterium]
MLKTSYYNRLRQLTAIAAIAIFLLISSCANEAPPTGGKKDLKPPKVKYSNPPAKSLNFKGDKIKIRFDEFIVQNLDPSEILVSPPLSKNPKYLVNGKNLLIKLPAPLKDSTTYTINFGDAIKDNNENNVLKNFTFVFATGNKLDSASISGHVINVKEPTKTEDIMVALYPADTTDGILHTKPYYFAQTDKSGAYKIENIKAGGYHMYALKDENLNYIYDQANELVGFKDTLITLNDSSRLSTDITVFESKTAKPKFADAEPTAPGRIMISYNAPIKTLKLDADILKSDDLVEVKDSKDTLIYWYSSIYAAKAKLILTANDTITDTTRVELKALSKDTTGDRKLYSLQLENESIKQDSSTQKQNNRPLRSPFKPIIVNLSRPVIGIDSNKRVYILNDSTKKADTVAFGIGRETKRDMHVTFTQKPGMPYSLVVPDSTLRDQWGWWNKKLVYSWQAGNLDNYGNILLTLKFDHPEKYYIFKILDDQQHTVSTFYYVGNQERKVTLSNMPAGNYHLQAIEDANKNGEWDSGDIIKKQQPEKIINFSEVYTLKGSWDLEIEVRIQDQAPSPSQPTGKRNGMPPR